MTAAEKLHQLIKALPENQVNEVLNFAEFLHQKQRPVQSQTIPASPLTELRGIAKRSMAVQKMSGLLKTDQPAPTDEEVAVVLEERRTERYLS